MNEIAETLRRYLGGERRKTANNKELRSAVLGRVDRARGKRRRQRGSDEQRRQGRIMRGEDDMESSDGRDREKKLSRHVGGERAGEDGGGA